MTSRSSSSTKRPLSAIFLGSNNSSSTVIPDLPEPPSPGASSNASGLPSPPATNSTGSGSVGDSNSNNAGSVRHRPSPSHLTMLNGNHHTRHISSSSALDDVQDANENGDEEEETAKFGVGRRFSASNAPSDNVSALERVKSLAKRNQEALQKLTGISRLNSPSPVHGRSSVLSRSPLHMPSSASSSSSSSHSSHNRVVSQPTPTYGHQDTTHSGSETERETHPSSADDRITTPPSAFQHQHIRQRLISAPESPSKSRARDKDKQISPPRQRNRASIRLRSIEGQSMDREGDDVTSAALAAVASSRRSPTGRKTRQPLPKEFRDKDRRSVDGQSAGEPSTPHRNRSVKIIEARRSPSPTRTSAFNSSNSIQTSPRPVRTAPRSSTLRDATRNKSIRAASDDVSYAVDDELNTSRTRRQSLRGGSAESSLAGNRSLVGEGLRAAGIMKRRETHDDVFREPFRELDDSNRPQSSARGSFVDNGGWEDSRDSDQARLRVHKRASLSMAGLNEGPGPDPRTPASASNRQQQRVHSRPATSMAGYHYDESPDGQRVSLLRANKSSAPLSDRDQDQGSYASSSRQSPHAPYERGYTSPYGISRQLAGTPISAQRDRVNAGEHGRLMFDSLSIFESHLSRLPPMGNTTTTTIPELFRSAQNIVQATDRLNTLLRNGTNKALEEQISAEVSGQLGEGNVEMSEHWRSVGSEFRDSLRVSDELVRNMTGFLLGVGKVLRETSSTMSSQQQHMRTVSLDEPRSEVAQTAGGRSSEGRSVAGSRRSWDLARREPEHRTLSREGANANRPPSSFRDRRTEDTPPTTTTQTFTSSGHRVLTPRERDSPVSVAPTASRRAILDLEESLNEPSPTPASRQFTRGALPPLVVPRPLPGLPTMQADLQSSDSEPANRKKMSTNSTATVRAGSSFQPTVTTPSATTAITPHTVSFPNLSRDSVISTHGVGLSRPSVISVSALTGLKQRESRSRVPSSNFSSSEEQSAPSTTHKHQNSTLSGSDRERESRWRTVGPKSVRMSLDGVDGVGNGTDSPESQTMRLPSSARRERRRTITEIFAGS